MKGYLNFRKIYLLPNLLTLVNISLGYLSILATFHGHYAKAALFIIFAAVIDGFDGIIARATKTQSDFGMQLDSFADAISFATASSLLIYFWGLSHTRRFGVSFFFCFIFFISAILRLSRFNILQKTNSDRKYYVGITVPSASLLIVSLVIYHPLPIDKKIVEILLGMLIMTLSLLMVSRIRYRNFLRFNFRQKIEISFVLVIAILFSGIIIFPKIFLIVYSSLNVVSGPFDYLLSRVKKRRNEIQMRKVQKNLGH